MKSYKLEIKELQDKNQILEGINEINRVEDKKQEKQKEENHDKEMENVFLTPVNDGDYELHRYQSPEEKAQEYDWFAGIYTEFGYCGERSKLFEVMESYNNPIDISFMIWLNHRGVVCEAARRGFQDSYAGVWRSEFYNVASLLYETLTYEEDKERFVAYVKSVEQAIQLYRDEIILINLECTNVPQEERNMNDCFGNGGYAWLAEEEGDIYRIFALKLIEHYNRGSKKYTYLTNEIESREGIGIDIPDIFQ
ncbi:hypothetical protein [Anaerosporobacter sp.]|uniref:hypothetical protein n=1 Tax=Anaerosporobacter sp. TaxID=1872529 RepID=UPI00286F5277|nr:hypothetical protein [Anaerosporobacter sp.]